MRRAMRRFAVIAAGGEMATRVRHHRLAAGGGERGGAGGAAQAWVDDRGVSASTNAEQRMALETDCATTC